MTRRLVYACQNCLFYLAPDNSTASYDHRCKRFAGVVTGKPEEVICYEARSDRLPDGYVLPELGPNSLNWAESCGPGGKWFVLNPNLRE